MTGSFSDDSMFRRVHREWVVALAGPRALLMQATHPVAWAGFFAHTGALDEPYERLNRTAQVMDAIAWGPADEADRLTRRVRAMHRTVSGELSEPAGRFPAGTPYRADDPAILLWILATLVDSALLVYAKYVGALTRDERDAYWQDYKLVGEHFGLEAADVPDAIEDFDAYVHDVVFGPDLFLTDFARDTAIDIVMRPPIPLAARPLLELANQVTIGLLPEPVRRLYGFRWDPVRGAGVELGSLYTKRLLLPFIPGMVRHVPRSRSAAPLAA